MTILVVVIRSFVLAATHESTELQRCLILRTRMQSKDRRRSRHPIGYFGVSSLQTLQVQPKNESTVRIDEGTRTEVNGFWSTRKSTETSLKSSTTPEKQCLERESLISVHRNKTHVS